MNSANNVNIDLRPGTRLVRETHGGREIMWVEDDTIFGTGSRSGMWFWVMLFVLGFIIFGSSGFSNQNSTERSDRDMPTEVHR